MERMVMNAVKGMPTTAPSRTDHFRARTLVSTPLRFPESDSSDVESAATDTPDLGPWTRLIPKVLEKYPCWTRAIVRVSWPLFLSLLKGPARPVSVRPLIQRSQLMHQERIQKRPVLVVRTPHSSRFVRKSSRRKLKCLPNQSRLERTGVCRSEGFPC